MCISLPVRDIPARRCGGKVPHWQACPKLSEKEDPGPFTVRDATRQQTPGEHAALRLPNMQKRPVPKDRPYFVKLRVLLPLRAR